MNRPPKQILDAVLASLRDCPDDWEFNEYIALNRKMSASIWLKNRHYGTHLMFKGRKWGDVTMASTLLGCFMPWRRKILNAADDAFITKALSSP